MLFPLSELSLAEESKSGAGRNADRLLAVILFLLAVLVLTRLDFLVNERLYGYGLEFSFGWYLEYAVLYGLSYQLVLLLLFLWVRDWRLVCVLEGFVLSSGQDLVFFVVWSGGFPEGEWTWVFFHRVFGFWNAGAQVLLTVGVTLASFVLAFVVPRVSVARLMGRLRGG